MSRVDIAATLEYVKNLPTRNPKVFTAVNRERLPQKSETDDFMRIIDVEVREDEKTITNDKTSLLLRNLKQNWGNTTSSHENKAPTNSSAAHHLTDLPLTSTDGRSGVRRSSNQTASAANVQPPKRRRGA